MQYACCPVSISLEHTQFVIEQIPNTKPEFFYPWVMAIRSEFENKNTNIIFILRREIPVAEKIAD